MNAFKSDVYYAVVRLGNVIDLQGFAAFPSFVHPPGPRARVLWSYIGARDAAVAMEPAVRVEG